MTSIKNTNSKTIISFLKANGFKEHRQKGSHLVLLSNDSKKIVIVPIHGTKNIPIGTILSILRQSGLTKKQLEEY